MKQGQACALLEGRDHVQVLANACQVQADGSDPALHRPGGRLDENITCGGIDADAHGEITLPVVEFDLGDVVGQQAGVHLAGEGVHAQGRDLAVLVVQLETGNIQALFPIEEFFSSSGIAQRYDADAFELDDCGGGFDGETFLGQLDHVCSPIS